MNIQKNRYLFFVLLFMVYVVITLIIFQHRIPYLFTHYAMPDVDTDGGLWYQWFLIYMRNHAFIYDVIPIIGYPFGYDISLSPASNLIYSLQVFILNHVTGFSWSNLIFITNISSLMTYPVSALGSAMLCYYTTRNKSASAICGLIFGFSFYHVFMGRGQMSINHIELIPFYILSLIYFLDKKNQLSLAVSVLLFALLFNADAYYAFFCGIFSVLIILFYKQEPIKSKIVTMLIYYIALFVVTVCVNLNFVMANLYLFNKTTLVATGRDSIPKNELADILYYFSPIKVNLLATYLKHWSTFFYSLTMTIVLVGSILLRKQRIYITFLACLLSAIVLSAYIPSLYWINEIYFKYFGMFRSVGRLPLPAYLFVGVLVGIVINEFSKSTYYKKISQNTYYGGLLVLGFIIIISSLNLDSTWYRNTDVSKLAKLYEPIKKNDAIHVIAAYPIDLNFINQGFPQPYQLIAQIIHEKAYANGASLGSNEAEAYMKSIKNILDAKTVDSLTNHNVDTIVIYNNLLKDAPLANNLLRKDPRVTFLGRFIQPTDKSYISASDLSRDISIYQINEVVSRNTHPKDLFFFKNNSQKINYKQVSSYQYQLTMPPKTTDTLVFMYPYSSQWTLYNNDYTSKNDLQFIGMKKSSMEQHEKYDGYGNQWKVENQTDQDKMVSLYYAPQPFYNIINAISTYSILFLSMYIVIIFLTNKYGKRV